MSKKDDVQLYSTQYGGLAKFIGEWGWVWVKKPNDPQFADSNYVPHEGLILTPANEAAREHEARCKAREEEWERAKRDRELAPIRAELALVETYAQQADAEDERQAWIAMAEELRSRITQRETK